MKKLNYKSLRRWAKVSTVVVSLLLALGLLMSGCSQATDQKTGASQGEAKPVKIRVGNTLSTDVSSVAAIYAAKNGAFKKAGLDVDLKNFVQSGPRIDAFKAGEIDVDVNMGAGNAAQMHSAGVPVAVLRALTTSDIWAVVVKKDSPYQKLEDFAGKRFGVNSMSGTTFAVTHFAFQTVGLDFKKDIKLSALPPSGLMAALEKGDLDGATLFEPHLTQAVKGGKMRLLVRPGDVYEQYYKEPFLGATAAARKDFYEKNKDAVAKLIGVIEQTLAEMDANLDAASQALAELPDIKLKPEEVKELIKPYAKNYVKQSNDPEFLKKVQAYYDRLYEAKQLRDPVKAAEFWVKP